jgi:GTP-binding protein
MPHFPPAEFLTSSWQPHQFPPDQGVEVAFAGRSNAGKSSALNAITGRRDLARTSKTPGRTQLINFFALNERQRLADLPGYGYAKVPEKMRDHWRQLLSKYVETRASLGGLVIVMDSRRPLTDFDWQMLEWTGAQSLPTYLLLTKADKLSKGEALTTLKKVRAEVGDAVGAQLFSAVTKAGVDEARKVVLRMLATTPSRAEEAADGS